MKVLAGTGATIRVTFYEDGVPTDADGAVTVTISRADGEVLVTDAAATSDTPTGQYSYQISGTTTVRPEDLTVVWTGDFSAVEQNITEHVTVVGGFYVALSQVRGYKSTLDDTTRVSNSRIVELRDWFEETVEEDTRRAFVPRHRLEVLRGDGTDTIILRELDVRAINSVSIDGTAVADISGWEVDPSGCVVRDSGCFPRGERVVVSYEYGRDRVPADMREAALAAISHRLLADDNSFPATATSLSVDGGTFGIATPGPNRPTGLPAADAVILRYRAGNVNVA